MASSGGRNDFVTFMYVPGEAGSIQRYTVRRRSIRRGIGGAAAAFLLLAALSVDYVRVRGKLPELDRLRGETTEQIEQIESYNEQLGVISERLVEISRLDRKLRVITNLDPADPLPLPGIGGVEGDLLSTRALTGIDRHQRMQDGLRRLGQASDTEAESLAALISHLEDQSARLNNTPSITPSRGWMTSTFGYRTSPFTGSREFHRGLDIAGRIGTPVLAPADGEIRYAGRKTALGNTVTIEHGYGM